MAYWLVVFLFAAHFGTAETQSFDRFLTLRSIFGTLNYSVRSLLLCNPTNNNPNDIRVVRAMDTGQGISLPDKTKLVHHPTPYMLTAYLMPNLDDPIDTRFGAYTCEVTVDNVTTRVTTFKLPSDLDAEVLAPPNHYLRASRGDRVELKVKANYQPLALRWKLNEHDRPEWENLTEVVIDSTTSNDSGVYECFYDGRRELGRHALIRLIVRECPSNKWGELCSDDCPTCYNDGICHAELGVCICPPGFDGNHCEIACRPNYFGEGCKKQCDSSDNSAPEDACAAFLFCLPDPYGCSCGPGFHGQYCLDDCEEGFYGAGCTQPCHCKEGPAACNLITGHCDDGCAFGWAGESCQISISNAIEYHNVSGVAFECPLGYFGFPYCNESCHCSSKKACDSTTGVCPSGCADGWNGTTCSECVIGKFGPYCDGTCHCDGVMACNGTTGACDGGCGPGYVGFSCQEGVPEILAAEDLGGYVGETVNITCLVWSHPPAKVQIASVHFPGLTAVMVQVNESIQVAWTELQLLKASSLTFNCSAFNNHGTAVSELTVNSFGPPVLMSAPTVVNLTSNALELQWDAWKFGKDKGGRMGDVMEYQVMVRLDGHDVWYEVSTWITPTAMRVTRLTPGTTYEFAVRCRLSGRKSPGEPGPYTTVETECQPNQASVTWPQDFQTEEVATNHVRLQWKEPTENDLGCPLQKYLLRYWPKDKPASQGLTVELPDDQDHYRLEGLQSGTEYMVELSAVAEDVVVGRPARISVTPHKSSSCRTSDISIPNASCQRDRNVSHMATVPVECNSGYELRGQPTVTCANGSWQNPPLCVPVCSRPSLPSDVRWVIPVINDGITSLVASSRTSDLFYVGESIFLVCSEGYFTLGDQITTHMLITCKGSDVWEPLQSGCTSKEHFTQIYNQQKEVLLEVEFGAHAVLPCPYNPPENQTELGFLWLKDEVEIKPTSNSTFLLHTNGTLTVTKMSTQSAGRYTCLLENNSQYLVTGVVYIVKIAAACVPLPRSSSMNVEENSSAIIFCPDSGAQSLYPPIWYDKNNVRIWNNDKYKIIDKRSLLIKSVHINDEGRIICDMGAHSPFCKSRFTTTLHVIPSYDNRCGQSTSIEFPWLVTLWWNDETVPFCYGALVNKQWVLTSASCLVGIRRKRNPDVFIKVGQNNSSSNSNKIQNVDIIPVECVKIHPKYSRRTSFADIGLVKLKHSVPFTMEIIPICLSHMDLISEIRKAKQCEKTRSVHGNASGWGVIVEEPKLPGKDWMELPENTTFCSTLSDDLFCAKGEQTASKHFADTGSPFQLLYDGKVYLYGIYSWGERRPEKGDFHYFVNVSTYYNWIISYVKIKDKEEVTRQIF